MAVVVDELEMAPRAELPEQPGTEPAAAERPPQPRPEDELARLQERERVRAMRLRAS